MMNDEEIHQMDEFAANFTARCYDILWIMVAVVAIGWGYFKLTGLAL